MVARCAGGAEVASSSLVILTKNNFMKILITGTPGSGKSAVSKFLKDAGFNSYDGETVDGLVRLEVKETGEPTNWPNGEVDWNYYAWNINGNILHYLLDTQGDVYVGISASNLDKFVHLFDKVYVLHVSNDMLENRLRNRKVHEFGQTDADIIRTLRINEERTQSYVKMGAVKIDNSRTLQEVARDITAQTIH